MNARRLEALRSPLREHDRTSFYKYVTAATARAILGSRSLRWSSPLLFNDPFDVPRELALQFTDDELHAGLVERFAQLLEDGAPEMIAANSHVRLILEILKRQSNPAVRSEIARELRQAFENGELRWEKGFEPLATFWKREVPTLRILCLSEVPDNTAMWAHYSDSHRGAVLELECSDSLDSPLLLARQVIYQKEPPSIATQEEMTQSILGVKPLDLRDLFREYFYVKTPQWEYEREWRVVTYCRAGESGLYSDWPIHPGGFKALFLGAEMPGPDRESLTALLSGELGHVAGYAAVPDPLQRQLRFQQI